MARTPTDIPSLATAIVEDATRAFARDDGVSLTDAVLRHHRSATRAADHGCCCSSQACKRNRWQV